jgi:stage V sporulation protein G
MVMLQITDIRLRTIEGQNKLKAVASITIDGEFVVHDIKIISGSRGLFIVMPSRKTAEGDYKDIAHPINSETRLRIQDMILDRYRKEIMES